MSLTTRVARKLRHLVFPGANPRLAFLQRMPKHAVCAEIGVWKGDFSAEILRHTAPKKLHLIDPWAFQKEFPDRMYGGSVAKAQRDMDAIFESVRTKFLHRRNIVLHRGFSDEVMEGFDDEYFDWVYIDGNHYYEYVAKDLAVAFRKVKSGGFITGDDYRWGPKEGFPVQRAVDKFVRERGLEGRSETIGSQFVIRKP